jgi:3-hydroxyisobutyrate dehydrogenase-like beta-hydroxyacid dehydrogenase
MGAAVGKRLADHGLSVLTSLEGRSHPSRARAREAGLTEVPEAALAEADFVLSIVPPAHAVEFAERMAAHLAAAARKAVFVDCNAVSPATVQRVAESIGRAGAPFVDAGIIGFPPQDGRSGPNFYACGPHAERFRALEEFGLTIRPVGGPIGAASALKMAYAGITKGIIAIGTSMILAAERAGVAEALHAELAESQQSVLAGYGRSIPGMFPKAYRWVAEMQEIAAFAGQDEAAAAMFSGASKLYRRLAGDVAGEPREIVRLMRFLSGQSSG